MPDFLWPQGLQHARLPCPSPTPGACSNSCPSSRWCCPIISFFVVPFSSCPQSFQASGFQEVSYSQPGGQSIGALASASVLPVNIQDWLPWELTGLISLQSKGLSRTFSNNVVQKHQFFGAQLRFSHTYMTTGKPYLWLDGPLSGSIVSSFPKRRRKLSHLFWQEVC